MREIVNKYQNVPLDLPQVLDPDLDSVPFKLVTGQINDLQSRVDVFANMDFGDQTKYEFYQILAQIHALLKNKVGEDMSQKQQDDLKVLHARLLALKPAWYQEFYASLKVSLPFVLPPILATGAYKAAPFAKKAAPFVLMKSGPAIVAGGAVAVGYQTLALINATNVLIHGDTLALKLNGYANRIKGLLECDRRIADTPGLTCTLNGVAYTRDQIQAELQKMNELAAATMRQAQENIADLPSTNYDVWKPKDKSTWTGSFLYNYVNPIVSTFNYFTNNKFNR